MKIVNFALLILLIVGCSSSEPAMDDSLQQPESSDTLPSEVAETENKQIEGDQEENSNIEARAPEQEPEEYAVSSKVYDDTFGEIEEFIGNLNSIIQKGAFQEWKKYLTPEFIKDKSDRQTLKELSQQPILKKYNIVLEDLSDYFKWVVMPSRSNVRLDKIFFLDEQTVRAIMYIENEPVILYSLKKVDDTWKIGN